MYPVHPMVSLIIVDLSTRLASDGLTQSGKGIVTVRMPDEHWTTSSFSPPASGHLITSDSPTRSEES